MDIKDVIGKTFVSQRPSSRCFEDYTRVTYKNTMLLQIDTCNESGEVIDSFDFKFKIIGNRIYVYDEDMEWMKYKIEWKSPTEYVAINETDGGNRELYALLNSKSDRTSPR